MQADEIERLHAQHKVTGSGPIKASEAVCMLRAIEEHRPRSFIEVGTSSGLSTGLLARMLHDNGGERLVSVDVSQRFYHDESRASGFLVPEVYDGDRVAVDLRSPYTSIDVPSWDETFDMGFIDGGHAHPWPLVDTLCVLPRLTGSRILFHHDLTLYKRQPKARGVGPKYLYDQFPDTLRGRCDDGRGNLFWLKLDLPPERLEEAAIDAFALPWTASDWKGGEPVVGRFREVLRTHYSADLLAAFDTYAERFSR